MEVGADLSGLLSLLAAPSGSGLNLACLVLFASRSMPVQQELGEGPSLDAAGGQTVAPSDALTTETRWPTFGPRVVEETGVRSILAVRLSLSSGDVAALTFCSRMSAAFGELATGLAALYAPIAALAVEQTLRAQDADQMGTALSSSRQIGTAIGIIMERKLITAEEAMEILRRSSQYLNRKLRDIAAEVTETGEMPTEG